MNCNKLNVVSSNVNVIQSSKQRLKMTQYFKNKHLSLIILLLQETHSTTTEAIWGGEFDASIFSHVLSNSCRVNVLNQMSENIGHILIF